MSRRLRILFPVIRLEHPHSFIARDIATLRTRHDVSVMRCVTPGEIAACLRAVRGHDLLFCWFGSLRYAPVVLTARALGRKVIVVAGGYDVANEPQIGYGNMQDSGGWFIARAIGRLLFRNAHQVVTYSDAGTREAEANALVERRRLEMIPLGFDIDTAPPAGKERLVLTVSAIDESTIYRKGLLQVARVSRLLPDVRFILAGRSQPEALARLRYEAGDNMEFPGFVSDEELTALYRRAAVYLQPSLHEAFGCSVAEAMAHRCVPVVSRRGSLPEVVEDAGFYGDPDDLESVAAAVRKALDAGPAVAEAARTRIRDVFPATRRHDRLLELVDQVAR